MTCDVRFSMIGEETWHDGGGATCKLQSGVFCYEKQRSKLRLVMCDL